MKTGASLCTLYLYISQENSAGDDIRYSPGPHSAHFLALARWVLFGGTEPVKEGNVTRGQGRERQGGRFTLPECSQWFTVGHIVTLTVHPGIGRVLEGVDR